MHRGCFEKTLGIGHARLQRVVGMFRNGDSAQAHVDLRVLNGRQSSPAAEIVDAYFWALWNHRGQTLAQLKDHNDVYYSDDEDEQPLSHLATQFQDFVQRVGWCVAFRI